jgi:outer membrane protein TolC
MPILNSDLLYNQKIKQQQVVLQEFEQVIYKRELIKYIKTAYYHYLSATEAINIYRSALDRALEGKRVNESLLANGKGLPAYVLRAQSEVETTKAQLVSSEKQAHNGQLYFNFLLNRDSSAPIDKEENFELSAITASLAENVDSSQREELKQVSEAMSLNQTILKMNKLYWSPKLSGFVDFGSQAQNWEFNNQSRYYLLGVQLDVPLFAGFTNRNKVHQSELDVKNAELNYSLVNKQLDMSAQISKNSLTTALLEYQASQKQLEAAQSYQRLIDKGYAEGVNSFIETVDARTQLTAAQLQTNINRYRLLISQANFERETASNSLTN